MRSVLLRTSVRAVVLAGLAAAAAAAFAANNTVFWIEPLSGVVLDRQVIKEVSQRAELVVIRAPWKNPDPDYTLPSVVRQFKAQGKAPVLSYAWANRYTESGRSEADLLRNLDPGRPLAGIRDAEGNIDFLDVMNPEVRNRVVSRFVAARETLGVDGFAIDLSTRTPNAQPAQLAKRCKQEATFCPQYASGMDALFADLRRGLGQNAFIAYNGLFNFTPGQVRDQAKLLASATGAAIEFFGMDPKEKGHSFRENILPFLEVIPTLPPDRPVLAFGRGSWGYTDYAEDYLWQRYLYASFLLAARPIDFFKYHATFQVPTRKGRASGIDYYDDWDLDLGAARGAAKTSGGIYWREFAGGLVAVAPDDGRGGSLPLPRTYYTPEGETRQGELRLKAGDGVILLASPRAEANKPPKFEIDARTMASWKWNGAQLDKVDGKEVLRIQPAAAVGDHDLLLDFERTSNPYEHLEIEGKLLDRSSAIQAVAEIDDPKREYTHVVFEVTDDDRGGKRMTLDDAVAFRAPPPKSGDQWPVVHLKKDLGNGPIGIGVGALEGTPYTFRRWSHLRIVGSAAIARIELRNRVKRLPEK